MVHIQTLTQKIRCHHSESKPQPVISCFPAFSGVFFFHNYFILNLPVSLLPHPFFPPTFPLFYLFLPLCKCPPLGLQTYPSLSCLKNRKSCLPSKYPSTYSLFYLLFLTLLSFNGMVYMEFPGGLVVRSPCLGPGFCPWSRKKDSHMRYGPPHKSRVCVGARKMCLMDLQSQTA